MMLIYLFRKNFRKIREGKPSRWCYFDRMRRFYGTGEDEVQIQEPFQTTKVRLGTGETVVVAL